MNTYPYLEKLQTTAGLNILAREKWIPDDKVDEYESLIDYVFSQRFLKRSYEGDWKSTNDYILKIKPEIMRIMNIPNYRSFKIEIMDMFMMNATVDAWKRYKQVYKFDNDFIEHLISTDTTRIPLQFFHDMPYKTFYIDLSECKLFPHFFGCMVNISFDEMFHAIPNLTFLRYSKQDNCKEELIFSGYFSHNDFANNNMLEFDGNMHDMMAAKDIPLDKLYINFDKHLVNADIERSINVISAAEGATAFHEENVQEFMMFMMQAILYLGSYKPDIRPRKSAKGKRPTPTEYTKIPEDIQAFDVGVRYGTTIRIYNKEQRKYQRDVSKGRGADVKPRKPTASHVRRAHWHTYRVGPGRKETILKWIPPTFVCGKPESLPVTIHKVL